MVRHFTDHQGRSWEVRVTGGAIKRVQDILGIDLGKLGEGSPPVATRLYQDVVFIVDVLYAVLKPQLDTHGIADEAFYELLDGDVASDAHDALVEELADFFQKLGQPAVARALMRSREIVQSANERAVAAMDSQETRRQIDRALADIGEAPGKSVVNSRPSRASRRKRTRSAS